MSTNPKTILIIEDEEDILLTLEEFFKDEGYKVLIAENGFEAMEILKTSELPDVILLDMKMPVMDGWEFSNKFTEKYGRKTPIVVMTAAADAEQRAKDIGADGWIEKPFDLELVLTEVKSFT